MKGVETSNRDPKKEHPRIITLSFTMRLGFRRDYGHKVPLSEWDRVRSGNQGLREGRRGRLQQERAILQPEFGTLWKQRGHSQVRPAIYSINLISLI